MSLSRGDVVLITFPFSDLTSAKVRPALVLSHQKHAVRSEDVLVCLITSNMARKGFCLIPIDEKHPDYHQTGFKVPSAIIADKIHTLNQTLIKRKLGEIRIPTIKEVQSHLKEILLDD